MLPQDYRNKQQNALMRSLPRPAKLRNSCQEINVNSHYTHYHDELISKLGNLFGEPVNYLSGINQKRIFARKRKTYLKKAISKVTPRSHFVSISNLSVLIELDHLVECLKSSIEKLMQLINIMGNFGLSPTVYRRKSKLDKLVSVYNIIPLLTSSSDTALKKLGKYLNKEVDSDWYVSLNRLRIEMYHQDYKKLFFVGDRLFITLPKNQKVDLLIYCDDEVKNVERLLSNSLRLLCRFQRNP